MVKGVCLGLGVYVIIITTFTTLDILPKRDVSAQFWEDEEWVLEIWRF